MPRAVAAQRRFSERAFGTLCVQSLRALVELASAVWSRRWPPSPGSAAACRRRRSSSPSEPASAADTGARRPSRWVSCCIAASRRACAKQAVVVGRGVRASRGVELVLEVRQVEQAALPDVELLAVCVARLFDRQHVAVEHAKLVFELDHVVVRDAGVCRVSRHALSRKSAAWFSRLVCWRTRAWSAPPAKRFQFSTTPAVHVALEVGRGVEVVATAGAHAGFDLGPERALALAHRRTAQERGFDRCVDGRAVAQRQRPWPAWPWSAGPRQTIAAVADAATALRRRCAGSGPPRRAGWRCRWSGWTRPARREQTPARRQHRGPRRPDSASRSAGSRSDGRRSCLPTAPPSCGSAPRRCRRASPPAPCSR